MADSEKLREIERLRKEVIEHHRPADIKRLDELQKEGPLGNQKANRNRIYKIHEEKGLLICEGCGDKIHKDQEFVKVGGKNYHPGCVPPTHFHPAG